MIIELIWPSLVAALLIAIAAGSLGPFVLWRRMAFFADSLAHSAILGTALAMFIEIKPIFGLLAYGSVLALLLSRFDKLLNISSDALLAIIAQVSLAAGMLMIGLTGKSINIERLLFGDILSVLPQDVILTSLICLAIITVLAMNWKQQLAICINEDLAATEGVKIQQQKLLLLLLLLALVAIAIQLLGVLLISTLLLIPAATAKIFAKTPTQMILLAPIFALAAVSLGLTAAINITNIAAGPAVVIAASVLFGLSLMTARPN